jgi:hypothetical protein
MKFNILLGSLLLTTLSAHAYDHYKKDNSCIKERWTLITEDVKTQASCIETKKLQLVSAFITYPNIDVGPMKVRFWKGQVMMPVETEQTYSHSYINVCSGKVTFTEEVKKTYVWSKFYEISNPNLDRSISESYKLAPLTNAEAAKAFENLKLECAETIEN